MNPRRIVSLCPSNTEILYALGVGEKVVGVDSYSDFPVQVRHLPRVGPDLRVSIEKIRELNPDLVVASLTVPGMERNIDGLKEANLPFVVLSPTNIEETLQDILQLGEITGTVEKAESLVDEIKYT
ncbi:MAG: ABC transporter substrate-binding protein, partial [Thermodesulfobacteriota bacterium]